MSFVIYRPWRVLYRSTSATRCVTLSCHRRTAAMAVEGLSALNSLMSLYVGG